MVHNSRISRDIRPEAPHELEHMAVSARDFLDNETHFKNRGAFDKIGDLAIAAASRVLYPQAASARYDVSFHGRPFMFGIEDGEEPRETRETRVFMDLLEFFSNQDLKGKSRLGFNRDAIDYSSYLGGVPQKLLWSEGDDRDSLFALATSRQVVESGKMDVGYGQGILPSNLLEIVTVGFSPDIEVGSLATCIKGLDAMSQYSVGT